MQQLPMCPVETTLTLISDKWKVLILRDLMDGTHRFGDLKKSIGHVTQKVLTSALRDMEASGLVTRTVFAEVPPRVEYALTDLGFSLKPVLDAMVIWGLDFKKQNGCLLNAQILGKNGDIARVQARNVSIVDVATALELMSTVRLETDCDKMILDKSNVGEDFFRLSTRIAGEILQKYVTYGMKMAIVGDFSAYPSKALQDFIRESNQGHDFYFVETLEEAIAKLE